MSDTYQLLRFGVFELNLELEEIRKNGSLLKLPPQPFKLLAMLASRSGQVVTREEIQQEIWGSDTFIDFEQGVNKCIKQIRTVLSDSADSPLYLETIPRRGYRFLAPVRTKSVPVPPPQVREASSALRPDVTAEVRSRIQAASQTSPSGPHRVAEPVVEVPVTVAAASPQTSAPAPRPHLLWGLLPLAALLVVVLYWFLSRPTH